MLSIIITTVFLKNKLDYTTNQRYHFLHFGTTIQITTSGKNASLCANTITEIDNLLAKLHKKWHPWLPGKLQTINNKLASMKPFQIDQETLDIINQSKKYYQLSKGYFNPAIGQLVRLWGFHKHNPEENTVQNNINSEINLKLINEIKKNIPNPNHIKTNHTIAINTNKFLQLDLSGFIKADAMLKIKDILLKNKVENALINIGGDIYIMGKKDTSQNWIIATNIDNKLVKINVFDNESIATSGINFRKYQDNNKITRHHIINPKTGEPALGFTSVTVINNNPYLADAAATALLIAGKEDYQEVIKSMEIDKFILFQPGTVIISNDMKKRITD